MYKIYLARVGEIKLAINFKIGMHYQIVFIYRGYMERLQFMINNDKY